jgi:hypothetical protein
LADFWQKKGSRIIRGSLHGAHPYRAGLFFCLATAAAPATRGFFLFFDHAVAAAAIGAFFGLASSLFGCPAFFTFEYCHGVTSGIVSNGYSVQAETVVLPDVLR